jgi:uncharacterized delta-60 repeat protein
MNGVQEAWVRHYASGNAPGYDYAADLAVDEDGNVYITGASLNSPFGLDFLTAKYDPAGNLLWTAFYNGIDNNEDFAEAIHVDSQKNVYVGGTSFGEGELGEGMILIKYSADGMEQWVARYDGSGPSPDRFHAMAVDDSGNVYVTGGSPDGGTSTGFVVIKYNTNGIRQWVDQYHDPVLGSWSNTSDLTLDTFGNVYVTGFLDNQDNYMITKYNLAGEMLWRAIHKEDIEYGEYYPTAIVVDKTVNVYVTGRIGVSANWDYLTVKYNQAGERQWSARYRGPDFDSANDVGVDDLGNVYVTGESFDENSGANLLTIKYDSLGQQLWKVSYEGEGGGARLKLDEQRSVYVTGYSRSTGNDDYITIKYDANGAQKWVANYDAAGRPDRPSALVIDQNHNVYVTGVSWGSNTGPDCATIKYNSNGVEQWLSRFNKEGNSNDAPIGVAVDDFGNVYVVGSSEVVESGMDFLIMKYTSGGSQEWTARYNSHEYDLPMAMTADVWGNVYVIGGIITKYSASGEEQWVAQFHDPQYLYVRISSFAVDRKGAVYVTGSGYGEVNVSDYLTVKFNAHGEQEWLAKHDSPGRGWDEAHFIAVDEHSNVYVTGTSRGGDYLFGNSNQNIVTIKYNSKGRTEWIAEYDSPENYQDFPRGMVLDSKGNLIVLNFSYGIRGQEVITIKYNTNGRKEWEKSFRENYSNDTLYVNPYDVTLDVNNNIYITAGVFSFSGWGALMIVKYDPFGNEEWVKTTTSLDYSASTVDSRGSFYVTGSRYNPSTNRDFFTIKFSPTGEEEWSAEYNYSANTNDFPIAITTDGWGGVYVTGVSGGWSGGHITTIKYTQEGLSDGPRTFNLSQNYPNPFNGATIIRYRLQQASKVELKIYNMLGQEMETLVNETQMAGEYEVRWQPRETPSGVFVYRIKTQNAAGSGQNFTEVRKMLFLK